MPYGATIALGTVLALPALLALGHEAKDEVLVGVALMLANAIRVEALQLQRMSCRACSSASDPAAWTAAVRRRPPADLREL